MKMFPFHTKTPQNVESSKLLKVSHIREVVKLLKVSRILGTKEKFTSC